LYVKVSTVRLSTWVVLEEAELKDVFANLALG
jgi:hypothetical protein